MPEYWRMFTDSFKVEYEGRLSQWKRRAIIVVGHVLHTKIPIWWKVLWKPWIRRHKVLGICNRSVHLSLMWRQKRGLCRSAHNRGERSWMTWIVIKFYTIQRGTQCDWLLKGFWTS
jgi:hypothetical protein